MSCPLSLEVHEWLRDHVFDAAALEWTATAGTTLALIAAAEIGDKSQLVCMTLATRHRALPVFLGTVAAFALLNLMAVLFGVAAAQWVPRPVLAGIVAVLFAAFGIAALRAREEEPASEEVREKSGHGVFVTAFLMIFLAEFGDKTQLATAGMSTAAAALPVWTGATLALLLTSALGVLAGRTVLQRVPLRLVHRLSGLLFLGLAAYAAIGAVPPERLAAFSERVFAGWNVLLAILGARLGLTPP